MLNIELNIKSDHINICAKY